MSAVVNVDEAALVPVESIFGEDEDETRRLLLLHDRAVAYITSFAWSGKVCSIRFGFGVGDIVGVFLVELEPASPKVDRFLWIVVGDLPSAYLVTDVSPNAAAALSAYIRRDATLDCPQ